MNRISLITYTTVTFLIIGAVVLINMWVGSQLKEPVSVTTPVVARPALINTARNGAGPRPPIIDPKNDDLAPAVQPVVPYTGKSEYMDPKNPPKKIYEFPLENGDILVQ